MNDTVYCSPLDVEFNYNLLGEDQKKSVYYEEVNKLISEYTSKISYNNVLTPQERVLLEYNTKIVNEYVNEKIRESLEDTGIGISITYPSLAERLTRLPTITAVETHQFIRYNSFSPNTFNIPVLMDVDYSIMRLLDSFFSGGSANRVMGNFCSLVPNIFAAFASLQSIYNNAINFAGNLQNVISSIKEQGVSGLINQLKQQLLSVIDSKVEQLKAQIQNHSMNFMSDIGNFPFNVASSMSRIRELKDKVDAILDEGVIEYLKKKVEGLIAYAANLFDMENFSLEEAQFLLLRFCELSGNIDKLFAEQLKPLTEFQENFTGVFSSLRSAGGAATARAIGVGATRMSTGTRQSTIERAEAIPPTTTRRTGGTSQSVPAAPSDPNAAAVGQSPGYQLRPRSSRIRPPSPIEINQVPSYSEVSTSFPLFRFSGGRAAWERTQLMEIVMLMRVARRWGSMLNINSAWRRVGNGASTSLHYSGQAFDISMSPSEHRRFGSIAREEGFGGVGSYGLGRAGSINFIHIDSWSERIWQGQNGGYRGSTSNISGLAPRL